jgi:hypothetical protein
MALAYNRQQIGVTRTTVSVTVPDNDIARLMYYLECVCTAIDCNNDPEIRRFTDYSNWHRLSVDEQRQLVVLCYTFSPDVFEGKVFFQKDALCVQYSNEFYEISEVNDQLIAARSIVIAGRTRRVNKIMAYKISWMQYCYQGPIQRQAQRFSRSNRSSSCVIF